MAGDKENEKDENQNGEKLVWTCTVCGGHYLLMPVIVHQEYSVDDETKQEYWGDIVDDDSEEIFVEKENQTHAFCKICGKETLCELRPYKPGPISGPNLLKDVEKMNDANLKSAKLPEDAVL